LNLLWTKIDGTWSLHKRNKISWGSIEISNDNVLKLMYNDKTFIKKFDSLKVAQNVSMTLVSNLNILNKSKDPTKIKLPGERWNIV